STYRRSTTVWSENEPSDNRPPDLNRAPSESARPLDRPTTERIRNAFKSHTQTPTNRELCFVVHKKRHLSRSDPVWVITLFWLWPRPAVPSVASSGQVHSYE